MPRPSPGARLMAQHFDNISAKDMRLLHETMLIESSYQTRKQTDDITCAYLLKLKNKRWRTKPDCHLSTKQGSIDAHIYIEGCVRRKMSNPALVKLETRSGKLQLALPHRSDYHGVILAAASRDGPIQIFLPQAFRGTLNLKSATGSIRLLKHLHDRSIDLSDLFSVRGAMMTEIMPPRGEVPQLLGAKDTCKITSKGGSIEVGFYGLDCPVIEDEDNSQAAVCKHGEVWVERAVKRAARASP